MTEGGTQSILTTLENSTGTGDTHRDRHATRAYKCDETDPRQAGGGALALWGSTAGRHTQVRGTCRGNTEGRDVTLGRSGNGQGQGRSPLRHPPTEGETPGEQTERTGRTDGDVVRVGSCE